MRLNYVLAVLALNDCGLVAAQNATATPAPSVTFAPTPQECTQICPTPAPEYCAPPCEYNYRYNPGEINKKLIEDSEFWLIHSCCWTAAPTSVA